MASVSFKFNAGELETGIRIGLDDTIRKDLIRRAANVRRQARWDVRSLTRNPTGRLENSIRFVTIKTALGWSAQIGSDLDYSTWVHEGTGIYGPRGVPIEPPRKQVFMFKSKMSAAVVVFTPQTLGMKPIPFLRDALRAAVI